MHVEVRRIDNDLHELVVQDNGQGLPLGFYLKSSISAGLSLVKKFSRQLNCEAKFENNTHSFF